MPMPVLDSAVQADPHLVCRVGNSRGNVNARPPLTSLLCALSSIERVYDVLLVIGGSDTQTMQVTKERAPLQSVHCDRAVTAEDLETLALRSAPASREKRMPAETQSGSVQLRTLQRRKRIAVAHRLRREYLGQRDGEVSRPAVA